MRDARRLIIDIAIMIGLGLVLALLGPFGMFEAPFALRLVYWLVMGLAGYGLFLPAMILAGRAAHRLDLPEPAMWAASCALASVPMSAVVWSAKLIGSRPGWPTLEQAAETYGKVLLVAAIACLIFWFVSAQRRVPLSPAAPPDMPGITDRPAQVPTPTPMSAPIPAPRPEPIAQPGGARLLERLPPHLGHELIALEMEDHYVRAHTSLGSGLILLRMRDAVAELDGVAGAQVHRSWWVARAAVTGVGRDGRNYRLRLSNGLDAPVARAMVAALQADGWLAA